MSASILHIATAAPPMIGDKPFVPASRVVTTRPEHPDALVSGAVGQPRPVLVAVHGFGSNAEKQARAWAALAHRRGMLLVAPSFDAERFDDYQRLGRTGRGARADLALLSLIGSLREAGHASGDLHLVGYSAGGQFVHRFALAWPERVRTAVTVAAGWYTFPDRSRRYPHGLRASARLPGVRFAVDTSLGVRHLVVVGELDCEQDPVLRTTRRVMRDQGPHRLARARAWVDAMNGIARARNADACARLETLSGVGHSFDACLSAGLIERVEAFLSSSAEYERERVVS